jgi:hypothetical protein
MWIFIFDRDWIWGGFISTRSTKHSQTRSNDDGGPCCCVGEVVSIRQHPSEQGVAGGALQGFETSTVRAEVNVGVSIPFTIPCSVFYKTFIQVDIIGRLCWRWIYKTMFKL